MNYFEEKYLEALRDLIKDDNQNIIKDAYYEYTVWK